MRKTHPRVACQSPLVATKRRAVVLCSPPCPRIAARASSDPQLPCVLPQPTVSGGSAREARTRLQRGDTGASEQFPQQGGISSSKDAVLAVPTTRAMQAYGMPGSPDRIHARRCAALRARLRHFRPRTCSQERDLDHRPRALRGICIPEASVSAQHARVHYRDGHWTLTDLGGRNGTIVDGEFVQEVALEHLHENPRRRRHLQVRRRRRRELRALPHRRHDPRRSRRREDSTAQPPRRRIVGGYQIDRLASALRRVAPTGSASSCSARAAPAKRSSPASSTTGAGGAAPSRPSTARPSRRTCSRASSSATSAARSPAPTRQDRHRARGGRRHALPRRDRRHARRRPRRSCCACIQSKEVVPLGATVPSASTCASCAPPTAICVRLQQAGSFRGDLYARLNEYNMLLPPPPRAERGHLRPLPRAPRAPRPGRARDDLSLHDGAIALRLPVQRARARGLLEARVRPVRAPLSTRRTCRTRSRI